MFTRPERIREEKSDRRLCTANGSAGPKKAWDNVTNTTIKNAFKHAAWLSADTVTREEDSKVWNWEDELPLSILASVLSNENVNFREYAGVENLVWTSGIPNDKDIDEAYKKNNQTDTTQENADTNFDDDESDDPSSKVSVPEIMECLLKHLQTQKKMFMVTYRSQKIWWIEVCWQRKITDYYFP
ncbi:hypothetical protein QE152_g33692 [Popillia japonica]|uniref:Uncharacterized protein n=1 Tax=Popillia japonica TaxID=7064 RepID=A0AAW1IVV2_POPJA